MKRERAWVFQRVEIHSPGSCEWGVSLWRIGQQSCTTRNDSPSTGSAAFWGDFFFWWAWSRDEREESWRVSIQATTVCYWYIDRVWCVSHDKPFFQGIQSNADLTSTRLWQEQSSCIHCANTFVSTEWFLPCLQQNLWPHSLRSHNEELQLCSSARYRFHLHLWIEFLASVYRNYCSGMCLEEKVGLAVW